MVNVHNKFQNHYVAKRDADDTSWTCHVFVILNAFSHGINEAKPIEALPYDKVD